MAETAPDQVAKEPTIAVPDNSDTAGVVAEADGAMAQSLVPPTAGLSALGESAEKAALEMQTKLNISALPVRQYLESSVVPILLQGLQTLVKERPNDPVEYLAAFLLKNNPNKK